MKRPIIAILPSIDNGRMALSPNYLNALWDHGALGCVLEVTEDIEKITEYAEMFDGFLISGGVDIDPKYYGEEIKFDSVKTDCARDNFESVAIKEFYKTGKPILGICRGLQALNAFLGGTLYQHIDAHRQQEAGCVQTHSVDVVGGSMLHNITGEDTLMVNTFHHQNIKDIAPTLQTDAVSDDGYIEAVHMHGHQFFLAVQWHPEIFRQSSVAMQKVFSAFVDAARSQKS